MSVVNNNLLLAGDDGGYVIDRSVRLRSSASAYFNRTFGSPTSANTWTYSVWVKLGLIGNGTYTRALLQAGSTNTNNAIFLSYNDVIQINNSAGSAALATTALYRDPSAWYHIVVSNNAGTYTLYVNNVSSGSASFTTTINNSSTAHYIGSASANNYWMDGYLTEINFIDGQALTPTSFGEYNEDTGVWQPKKYAGTYGTNGFYLNFSDPASTTTIGADSSGNGNNWTSNNISVTAGATYDSMIDTPTPVADVRGNFCVANPLDKGANSVAASGNLDISSNNGTRQGIKGTFGVATGKWYFEYTKTTAASASVGVASAATTFAADSNVGSSATSWGYLTTGDKLNNNSSSAYGATWTTNDVIGVAFDMDAGTITFYKNNSSQGQAFSGITGTVFPMGYNGSATADNFNFGQRPFAYTPPSGFKALHTGNLPEPAIVDGGEYFNPVLYTGNGSTNNVTGVGFQPDFVWLKARSAGGFDHVLQDVIRGSTRQLYTNTTDAEVDDTDAVTSFNADGFTSGADVTTNNSGTTYVAWNWKANGAGVSNTAGSITSTVSAGVTQGFSVVTYTGTNTIGTVGHGLGVAPAMIIVKPRDAAVSWVVYHKDLGATKALFLDSTIGAATDSRAWNNTAPTSSVFTVNQWTNWLTGGQLAYCFAEVPGYSRFGSYTGNGSADGPFVFCGFRPAFILTKRSDSTSSWYLRDTSRSPYNAATEQLYPDLANAEANETGMDILSNGFKQRGTSSGFNTNGGTYIYMAFAEHPFKNALAR